MPPPRSCWNLLGEQPTGYLAARQTGSLAPMTGYTERNCFPYTRMVRLKPAVPLEGKWRFQRGFPYSRISGQYDSLANAYAAPFIILWYPQPRPCRPPGAEGIPRGAPARLNLFALGPLGAGEVEDAN